MGFISDQLIKWHKTSGRHNLPWQNTDDPYLIWLSEVMLQQTQVSTVLTYFNKFIKRFPNINTLASAKEERVLELWSGLGYYARARNLHKTAIRVSKNYEGKFPSSFDTLLSLPGIGRSTAGAISAFAFKKNKPILDGNVKRVFTRYFGIKEWAGKLSVEKELWEIATRNLPKTNKHIHTYTQALMDLGATICRRNQPLCNNCPLQSKCISFEKNLTKEIPTSKPKKALPINEIYLLIINSNDSYLFKKKPSKGVWAGLWSMPEIENFKSSSNWLKENLNEDNYQTIKMGEHKTSFSHYKLNIYFQYILLKSTMPRKIINYKWINKRNLKNTALPSPINKILSSLENG
jgi:A/G-specific adenine glycosylase|tara:strand:+ start:1946 stop:2989 length:1044 start_codon:yes stop_codon:yes gene_type:complete